MDGGITAGLVFIARRPYKAAEKFIIMLDLSLYVSLFFFYCHFFFIPNIVSFLFLDMFYLWLLLFFTNYNKQKHVFF